MPVGKNQDGSGLITNNDVDLLLNSKNGWVRVWGSSLRVGGDFCIHNTCINEKQLQILTGQAKFMIQSDENKCLDTGGPNNPCNSNSYRNMKIMSL